MHACKCNLKPLVSSVISHACIHLSESHFSSVLPQYTEAEAKKLSVTGWVKNTRQGTVVGQVQGHPEKVQEM